MSEEYRSPGMHTPGPWRAEIQPNQFNASGYTADIAGLDGDTIARLTTAFSPGGRTITREEVLANARLMTLAPELADALRTLANWPSRSATTDGQLSGDARIGLANVRRFARILLDKLDHEAQGISR